MISSEMSELLGMSDRIMVMSNGKMEGILDAKDATEEKNHGTCYGRFIIGGYDL